MKLKRTFTSELKAGKRVLVKGWVSQVRDLGGLKFFLLRDRCGEIQVTVKKKDAKKNLLDAVSRLVRESCVIVQGRVKKSKQISRGIEVIPESLEILSNADPLPIEPSDRVNTGLDKRLDWRSLDLRDPKNLAIFKIESKLIEGMEEYLRSDGFIQVFTPCIMGSASEGGADVFKMDYFGKDAFLRQDPQLHRQLALIGGLDRIFDIGPNWRAEHSHTPRHLCEHRGIAVELSFISDEKDVMRVEEKLVVSAFKRVEKDCKEELKLLGKKITIPRIPFPLLEFPNIYKILENMGKKIKFGEEYDTESEKLLWEWVKKKHRTDFYFVNRFPFNAKPFYVMRVDDDPQWARSTDLVYKGVEQSSGGQREHRYEKIIEQAKVKGMNLKDLEWFTKFFKYGAPPHGGFCLGLERLTQMLLDINNIRETSLFPRAPERLLP